MATYAGSTRVDRQGTNQLIRICDPQVGERVLIDPHCGYCPADARLPRERWYLVRSAEHSSTSNGWAYLWGWYLDADGRPGAEGCPFVRLDSLRAYRVSHDDRWRGTADHDRHTVGANQGAR